MPAPVQKKMIGWYDPLQLLLTAQKVAVSTIFGEEADYREMESVALPVARIYDCSKDDAGNEKEAVWIDYVADTGDGWDSTFTIAHCVAQPTLQVVGAEHALPRADVLVFGGDEVYPTASRDEYKARLIDPYSCALRETKPPHPQVFALPGNHDWYDNLVSFTRLFCAKQWFGGWLAPQTRSYFALRLGHGWWLLAFDLQLESDIDPGQVDYFEYVASWEMSATDRIILCTPEPYWIYDHIYGQKDPTYRARYERFADFIENTFKGKVAITLAGDLHHYRRHEQTTDPAVVLRQKITSGGGGAFLHPTHGPDVSVLEGGYDLKASFPEPSESSKLAIGNLLFAIINPRFGVATAIAYLLVVWEVKPPIGHLGAGHPVKVACIVFHSIFRSPGTLFWPVAILSGFWLFTDTHRRWYRFTAGSIHAITHLKAAFLLYWLALRLLGSFGWLAAFLVMLGGYFAGPSIMGIYLYLSLNVFHRHSNEAFSSLAICDWKHFLRMRVDATGVTIFPIGISKVPRKWRKPGMPSISEFVPDDPKATPPELIEPPISVIK